MKNIRQKKFLREGGREGILALVVCLVAVACVMLRKIEVIASLLPVDVVSPTS